MKELNGVFEALASFFSVMAEPMRLRILHAICHDEKSVNEIVSQLGATQTNVSRHLGVMYRARVVVRRKHRNQVFYRISSPDMIEICRSVCMQIAGQVEAGKPLRKNLMTLLPARRKRAGTAKGGVGAARVQWLLNAAGSTRR